LKLALLTIGQSPRKDIIDDIGYLLKNVDYEEYGALDGLTKDYIDKYFSPKPGEDFYVTRLADGTEVRVSKKVIEKRVQEVINSIEEHIDLIVILCTGDFNVSSKKPILIPSKILIKVVETLSPRNLLVFVPAKGQEDMSYRRWSKVVDNVVIRSWSPYSDSIEKLKEISKNIGHVDLVVMDCIGYSTKHAKVVKDILEKPVLIPRVLTIAVATSMI